jgi:hypothetical protein
LHIRISRLVVFLCLSRTGVVSARDSDDIGHSVCDSERVNISVADYNDIPNSNDIADSVAE